MEKTEIINGIAKLQERLRDEVKDAYDKKGVEFGKHRFDAFKRVLTDFINKNLPSESSNLNNAYRNPFPIYNKFATDGVNFWNNDGDSIYSYLESLVIDIDNGEIHLRVTEQVPVKENTSKKPKIDNRKVFIVHGHDGEAKSRTARFIEKLGFEAIILHEQVSRGKTIIEKIEQYSNVGFAIVLYTPDDVGNDINSANESPLNNRARQNVVFEHGYLMAKIGRENVIPLVQGNIELPSDISGVVYITDVDWQTNIAREMKLSGYEIDFNNIFSN
ncbi:TPA: nucleotide-binding protein [Yersinia enterocolitica]|nr:nucleotide-binding protein [Yersinia enterocolitica]